MADLMGMMGKVRELQDRMQKMQAELDTLEVIGLSGGGLVSVTLTAKGAMKKVTIDPSLMKADEREIVEDLISPPRRGALKGRKANGRKNEGFDGRFADSSGIETVLIYASRRRRT